MSDRARVETELNFLSELERREVVTQMSLAKRVSVSVGLVNALLKRAMKKGFVKAKAAPYKRYAYYLTPKGFNEKSRLVAEYLESSLDFFRTARTEYNELFLAEKALGKGRFVLAGQGELLEIAILSAREQGVDIEGILGVDTDGQTSHFGVPVISDPSHLSEAHTLIIAESRRPQSVYDRLRGSVGDGNISAPEFLCITREPLDFAPPPVAPKGKGR